MNAILSLIIFPALNQNQFIFRANAKASMSNPQRLILILGNIFSTAIAINALKPH